MPSVSSLPPNPLSRPPNVASCPSGVRKTRLRRGVLALALLCGLARACDLSASEPLPPGTRVDTLTVGSTTYRGVEVRSIGTRTLVITHSGGMSSIRLRDLSPEWQERCGYDPKADATASGASPRAGALRSSVPTGLNAPSRAAPAPAETGFSALIARFGEPAAPLPQVDLRPKFFALELGAKNQGRRPSCAVFAVVSALEFQNAEAGGRPEKFSEEYLIWATRKTLRPVTTTEAEPANASGTPEDADQGFSLLEVIAALRGYGIPRQSSMPNTFGRAIDAIEPPPDSVVEEARARQWVFIHALPGRDNATRINNLVHALNAGIPVPIGMAWPHYRAIHGGFLSEQQPMTDRGHAVTIVGYLCPTGRVEEATFLFKNSWGVGWGQGGYGTATYRYLERHLNSAVILEVQPAR